MENNLDTFQSFWETSRQKGKHISKYPYDKVISFVFRYCPHNLVRSDVKILEIGSGAGNNLWALAKEGFQVYGIDASKTAISIAKQQFENYGVTGHFYEQDFTQNYPLDRNSFDLVIDRGALSCVCFENAVKVLSNIYDVIKTGGFFFFNPFSTKHSSYTHSQKNTSGNYIEPTHGTITGVGKICFYDYESIELLLNKDYWKLQEVKELIYYDYLNANNLHAEWEVVAQKL